MRQINNCYKTITLTLISIGISLISASAHGMYYSDRDEVKSFVKEIAAKHKFDEQETLKLFNNLQPIHPVIKNISQPFETVPWENYRKIFLNQQRIDAGIQFWRKNINMLKVAEKDFGVPASIIVSIIGVESFYGKHKGSYPVLNTLATLAFDYPPRAKFFTNELEQFLLMTKEQKLDPLSLSGSYAGAMGLPQFIPSSYRYYAISNTKDKKGAKLTTENDAILSIANYFYRHGWQKNKPVVHKAKVSGDFYKQLLTKDQKNPKPEISINSLKEHGITAVLDIKNENLKVSFLELENSKGNEYWLGRDNFYTITRYNRSTNYAMAVYQLSKALEQQYTN